MRSLYYTIALCLFLVVNVWSQNAVLDSITVTLNVNNQPLPVFLNQLEEETDIRFFYKKEELPAKTFNFSFQKTPLSDVLYECFRNTSLGYMAYRDYAVIIAPQNIIEESFSANYYQALENAAQQEESRTARQRKIIFGNVENIAASGRATISGTIKDAQTEEPIIGATIFFTEINTGTATDFEGNFTTEIPVGDYEMVIEYVGYEDIRKNVSVYSAGSTNLTMNKAAINLEEVIVRANAADANVENVQIGVTRLDVAEIKKLPALFGEADVVRTLLLNPGVSTVGEGATGFNVRGGSVDQNLIMQDEGFIFNSSHALGFFSTFNPDLIRGVELYKGNIPAQFGGRLASVLDVEMRDGNFEAFKIKGGAGPVSSRISFEGPIIKEKSSFLAGFRSTYADWLIKQINVEEVKNSSAFFYDANLRITNRLGKNNTLTLAGYASSDEFTYNKEFGFDYQTYMGQVMLNTIFNDQLYNKLSAVYSVYQNTQTDLGLETGSELDNDLAYTKVKNMLTYSPDGRLKLDVGASAILYETNPGSISPQGVESQIIAEELETENGLEMAGFANMTFEVGPRLELSGGLRYVLYQFRGPQVVNEYENDDASSLDNLIGSSEQSGKIADYNSLEPRFSARLKLSQSGSVKAGYSRTAQFINQLFNTATPTPTSQYQLSTKYIRPQRSHNLSVGYFQNFGNDLWETSVEVFARQIDETFDYRDFANLNVNPYLETDILYGEGRAGGIELSIRKDRGTINGFMSYTLSRTELQIEGINRGNWYPANFDKPHDFSLVMNWNPNQRHTVTLNFNYGTGRPVTPPLGNYETERGLVVPVYSERNQVRIPDYHRLDIAYTIGKGYKKTSKVKTSWTISIYNVYGRKNAFSVFYTQGAFQLPQANQLAVLGSAFPAITFNLEIL